MDNFLEEIVVRRNAGVYNFLYALAWAALVLSALLGFVGLQGALTTIMTGQINVLSIVLFVVFGGVAFLIWKYKDALKTDYEYTFTNGDLDVAKVLNNAKRKYLTSLELKNVEACGAVTNESFKRYLSMPDIKKHNWFLNREAMLYYFYFVKKGVKHLMIVELSDEMIGLVRKPGYLGFQVWQG